MNVSVMPQNNILIRIYKEVNRLGFNKASIILTQLKIGVSERCQMSLSFHYFSNAVGTAIPTTKVTADNHWICRAAQIISSSLLVLSFAAQTDICKEATKLDLSLIIRSSLFVFMSYGSN